MLDELVEDFIDHSALPDSTDGGMPMTETRRGLNRFLGSLREITRSAVLGLDDAGRRQSADVLEAFAAALRSA